MLETMGYKQWGKINAWTMGYKQWGKINDTIIRQQISSQLKGNKGAITMRQQQPGYNKESTTMRKQEKAHNK